MAQQMTRRRGDGRVFVRGARWWIAYYVRGKEHREPGGTTEKAAGDKLRQRLAEIRLGQFVGPQQERVKVSALLDAYLTDRRLAGKRSLPKIESAVRHLTRAFGGWRAVEVTLPRLKRYLEQQLAAAVARGTIKVRLAFLSAAFNVTRRDGLHTLRPDFPTISVNNARRGFFSAAEFAAVRTALPAPLDDVALFAYLTGWRKEEVLGLSWAEVDRAERAIRLGGERTKNGRPRMVPLIGDLAALIDRRWAARVVGRYLSPVVFHREGRPVRSFDKAWATACAEAGLPGRLFHDLRRTAVRDMTNAGVPKPTVKATTGHLSDSVFERYQIVAPEDQVLALERTQAHRAAELADNSRTVTPLQAVRR